MKYNLLFIKMVKIRFFNVRVGKDVEKQVFFNFVRRSVNEYNYFRE